jgi:hypothetical protein
MTLDAICAKWGLDKTTQALPIEIPNVGRDDLASLFAELGFTRGVEVGVKEGAYSEVLCQRNPDLQLCSVDPYLVRDDYRDYRDQREFNSYYEKAKARLATYNCVILREKSLDAVRRFDDRSLDFVYIDGHHNFENCANDICAWTRKVRVGGIVAGHDYVRYPSTSGIHVIEVVNAFTRAYRIRPWFVLGKRDCAPGEYRDRHRSFFWVRGPIGLDHGR